MRQPVIVTVLIVVAVVGVLLGTGRVRDAESTTLDFEAETMYAPDSKGRNYEDTSASGGAALLLHSNTTVTKRVTPVEAEKVVVRVRGDQCHGSPLMTVKVDGQRVMSEWVWQTEWTDYAADVDLPGGEHTLEVAVEHDLNDDACDRNLRVDKISLVRSSESDSLRADTSDPFADGQLYVDPGSKAGAQADEWRSSRPNDAAQMDKIAAQPQARWVGGSNQSVQARTKSHVSEAAKAGSIPVLVAYNIPNRDCGQYSSGGLDSAESYRGWIRSFADGIGDRKAIVILEPDALAFTRCLSEVQEQERFDLIRDAVNVLKERSNALVYIDAGTNEDWISAEEMASRLRAAGISEARGFSLNVANHYSIQREIAYGKEVSSRVGDKHFVIDTSRNGNGRNGESCNAPGRALGKRPTLNTGQTKVDAYLWIKVPGESDGACYGSSRAGEWLPEYALDLARRAAF